MKLGPGSARARVQIHAFSFEGGAWERLETTTSTIDWDAAEGVAVLTAAADLAFRSAEVLQARVQGDTEVDEALLAAFVDAAGNPVKPAGWPYTEKDLVSYRWHGAYLLATLENVGSHPRLYRRGRLVWSSDSAQTVTFWPQPRRAALQQGRAPASVAE